MPRYSSNPPGSIKSIQTGVIFMATTEDYTVDTVTAVDVNKSILYFLGSSAFSGLVNNSQIHIYLLSSTEVAAERHRDSNVSGYVSYMLVEYY